MGQQQLILLVLGTIIVGVAIVVGIRAFTENSAKSNADALTQDAVRMANDVQAWVKKPAPFGGAADGEDWTDATLADLGLGAGSVYTNLNGKFTITDGVIDAYGFDGSTPDSTLSAAQQHVQVRICGMTDTGIKGATLKLNGTAVASGAPAC